MTLKKNNHQPFINGIKQTETSHQDYLICINDHFHDVNFIPPKKTLPTSDEPILRIDLSVKKIYILVIQVK